MAKQHHQTLCGHSLHSTTKIKRSNGGAVFEIDPRETWVQAATARWHAVVRRRPQEQAAACNVLAEVSSATQEADCARRRNRQDLHSLVNTCTLVRTEYRCCRCRARNKVHAESCRLAVSVRDRSDSENSALSSQPTSVLSVLGGWPAGPRVPNPG